jgi:hypothetical protein
VPKGSLWLDLTPEQQYDRMWATWLSKRDCAELIAACIEAEQVPFAVVSGISANPRQFWDLSHGPADDAARVVPVEQGDAEAVDAVATDAVVDAEPAGIGQQRRSAGADLELVSIPWPRVHDLPIVAPVDQVV